jgi:hypothetical protein
VAIIMNKDESVNSLEHFANITLWRFPRSLSFRVTQGKIP